jgi:hypothetical protein
VLWRAIGSRCSSRRLRPVRSLHGSCPRRTWGDSVERAPGTREPVEGRVNSAGDCSTACQATIGSPPSVSNRKRPVTNDLRRARTPALTTGILWTTMVHDFVPPEADTGQNVPNSLKARAYLHRRPTVNGGSASWSPLSTRAWLVRLSYHVTTNFVRYYMSLSSSKIDRTHPEYP